MSDLKRQAHALVDYVVSLGLMHPQFLGGSDSIETAVLQFREDEYIAMTVGADGRVGFSECDRGVDDDCDFDIAMWYSFCVDVANPASFDLIAEFVQERLKDHDNVDN